MLCRAILLEDGPIPAPEKFSRQVNSPLAPLLKENEFNTVINAINAAAGNKSKAAKLLGISRKTLYAKLKQMETS